MSNRSIRRAAERAQLKAARKAARQQHQQQQSVPAAAVEQQQQQQQQQPAQPQTPEISAARLAANRANAQHSCGPKTSATKAISSLNALKTGLTGVTVLLPSDDVEAYKTHILSYEKQFKPVGPEERALTQSLADLRWRLNRIPALELALIDIAHRELAESDEAFQRPDLTPTLEMEIRLAYAKEFRNLHLQENRLARRREKELAELNLLQSNRKKQEKADLAEAYRQLLSSQYDKTTFRLEDRGFEFSKERFIEFLRINHPGVKYQEDPAGTAEAMQATA